LDRCGIARALIYTHALGPTAWEVQNRQTRQFASGQSGFVPCSVLPQHGPVLWEGVMPAVEELLESGARAFRLDGEIGPAAGPLTLDRFPDSAAIWRRLEERRVPVFVPGAHLPAPDRRFGYGLDEVVQLCTRHPALPVVLLSPPYALERQLAHALSVAPNLHLSTARLGLFGQLETFVRAFGAGRLLFGSGLPFNDPAIPSGVVRYADLPGADKRLIAAGNLDRLLSAHD
jgi:predicted TIM-barrel fold metal-dependent hydrolase